MHDPIRSPASQKMTGVVRNVGIDFFFHVCGGDVFFFLRAWSELNYQSSLHQECPKFGPRLGADGGPKRSGLFYTYDGKRHPTTGFNTRLSRTTWMMPGSTEVKTAGTREKVDLSCRHVSPQDFPRASFSECNHPSASSTQRPNPTQACSLPSLPWE